MSAVAAHDGRHRDDDGSQSFPQNAYSRPSNPGRLLHLHFPSPLTTLQTYCYSDDENDDYGYGYD